MKKIAARVGQNIAPDPRTARRYLLFQSAMTVFLVSVLFWKGWPNHVASQLNWSPWITSEILGLMLAVAVAKMIVLLFVPNVKEFAIRGTTVALIIMSSFENAPWIGVTCGLFLFSVVVSMDLLQDRSRVAPPSKG